MEEKREGGAIWGYEIYVPNSLGEDNNQGEVSQLFLANIMEMAHSAVQIP